MKRSIGDVIIDDVGSVAEALSLENLLKRERPIKTGFPMLDDYMEGGITPGVIVLGAGPSQGKSTLALQISEYVSREEKVPVLYFSLEMARERITAKSIAMDNFRQAKAEDASVNAYQTGKEAKKHLFTASELFNPERVAMLSEEKRAQYQKAQKRVAENKLLHVIDEACSAAEIKTTVEQFLFEQREQLKDPGEKIKKPLVIVDYLQIIPPDPNARGIVTDKQQVDHNLRLLRGLAQEKELPILLISSLKRGNYSGNIYPMEMDAFKETGGIEYSADFLFGLQFAACHGEHGCDSDFEKKKYPRQMELVILKQRYGMVNVGVPLRYYAEFDYLEQGSGAESQPPEEASAQVQEPPTPAEAAIAAAETKVHAEPATAEEIKQDTAHKPAPEAKPEKEEKEPFWKPGDIAYINNTKVAYEIRKQNWTSGEKASCNVAGNGSKQKLITEFTLTGQISNFDCDVADVVYSLYKSGKEKFLTRHVLYALSGNSHQTLTTQKETQIGESLKRLMAAHIVIHCEDHMKMKKRLGDKTLIEGQFLQAKYDSKEKAYVFTHRKGEVPMPLYLYAEQTNQMIAFPKKLLYTEGNGDRRIYDTEENIMIKRYLLRRLEIIRKSKKVLPYIRKVVYYNSTKGLETGMLTDIGVRREDYEAPKWSNKLRKTHETVLAVLDILVANKYLSGYELNDREGVNLNGNVRDPFKLKLK